MAAKKTTTAKKGPAAGRGTRGRMPTKRTINLMLVEEGKIRARTAIPAILAIIVLAALFSKYMVIDRLTAVNQAQGRAARLQQDLDSAKALLEEYGDVDTIYAHYTYEGMTAQEMGRVDRDQVMQLVVSILPKEEEGPTQEQLQQLIDNLFRKAPVTGNDALDAAREEARQAIAQQLIPVPPYVINAWSVKENVLTLDVSGQTLERMNELGREIEKSPIVNSCTLTTANKGQNRDSTIYGVRVRFIVYLQQADETKVEPQVEDDAQKAGALSNFGAVTQFVGGEASEP